MPIIPVVFEPYSHVYCFKNKIFNAGKLTVHVLPPISTTALTISDVPLICEKVRNQMMNVLELYNNAKPKPFKADDTHSQSEPLKVNLKLNQNCYNNSNTGSTRKL